MACTAAVVATIVDCVMAGWPIIWAHDTLVWPSDSSLVQQKGLFNRQYIAKCAAATGKWWLLVQDEDKNKVNFDETEMSILATQKYSQT